MINTAVFDAFPILQTARLTLRDIRPEDAESIFRMRSSGMVNRFIPRPGMETLESASELIDRTVKAYQNQQAIGWAGILRNNGTIIGTCGFNQIDIPNRRAEIGGELSTEFWGKHIAIEAVQSIIQFGFDTLLLHSIEAKVSPDNRGAVHLLEGLGFVKEAHYRDRVFFNDRFSDMAVYTKFNP